MKRLLMTSFLLLALMRPATGEDEGGDTAPADAADQAAPRSAETAEAAAGETPAVADDGTRTMSGMSVLGNEEAPKSLVIIPWKSSEIGSDLGLSDTLDERARPVDKEVFRRQLRFYEIRADEEGATPP